MEYEVVLNTEFIEKVILSILRNVYPSIDFSNFSITPVNGTFHYISVDNCFDTKKIYLQHYISSKYMIVVNIGYDLSSKVIFYSDFSKPNKDSFISI